MGFKSKEIGISMEKRRRLGFKSDLNRRIIGFKSDLNRRIIGFKSVGVNDRV